jgi:hypothetical protein
LGLGYSWISQKQNIDISSDSVSLASNVLLVAAKKSKGQGLFDIIMTIN